MVHINKICEKIIHEYMYFELVYVNHEIIKKNETMKLLLMQD